VEVYGASAKSDHAEYLYPSDHYSEGQFYIGDPGFLARFNDLLERWRIDVVIPTHDSVALFLAEHAHEVYAKLLTADAATARICREKRRTYDLFTDCRFCPKVFRNKDEITEHEYPVFAKPNIGEGGKNTVLLRSISDLNSLGQSCDYVLCEYLPGDEYTVDCFTNRKGGLIFCGCRQRDRIQLGIAFRSHTIELTEAIKDIAKSINDRLRFFGGWYFQIKRDHHGEWKLMEISCRHAGTMTLYRHKGINFALMGIYEINGIDTSAMELPGTWWLDRCLRARFCLPYNYETVYVDLDDTLIVKGMVNTGMISFLYQCVNDGKRLILLTRHAGVPSETLNANRIAVSLFNEIIHLMPNQSKADAIKDRKSIFIDNSFAERSAVFNDLGVPSFALDSVSALLK
jgi:hypothetical protein